MRGSVAAKLGLVLASVVIGLGLCEATLHTIGFHFHLLESVQFGWPDPTIVNVAYVPDPDLFWVPRDYENWLERARTLHPNVVFLGDSCTEFGTYPRLTAMHLAKVAPKLARDIKLGVGGWSSEQGRAQMERDVLQLAPSVVTIYYGWNDHWEALGPTDDHLRPGRSAAWFARHFRLGELWLRLRMAMLTRANATDWPNRVSLARYEDNLVTMVRQASGVGARVVLITAPSNHVVGHEPIYLAQRHLRNLDELVPLHRSYVEATRAAARESGAFLCDAAAAFETVATPHNRLFMKDGIHLSDPGNEYMADLLSGCILEAVKHQAPVAHPPL